jgi:hypothetical protein
MQNSRNIRAGCPIASTLGSAFLAMSVGERTKGPVSGPLVGDIETQSHRQHMLKAWAVWRADPWKFLREGSCCLATGYPSPKNNH